MKQSLEYENLLVAIAYGDAYGLPFETRTNVEIDELGGPPVGLIQPDTISTYIDFIDSPLGTVSDDTQHACATARVLTKGFTLQKLAAALRKEMAISSLGWGGATKQSLAQARSTMSIKQLTENGHPSATGCGPLMRSSPLALYAYFDTDNGEDMRRHLIWEQRAQQSSMLTHRSTENTVSSLVHHRVLLRTIMSQDFDYDAAIREAVKLEQRFSAEPVLSMKLKSLYSADLVSAPEKAYESNQEAFRAASIQAISYFVLANVGCRAPLIDHLRAVVACGGDTDSTAAIVGSLWAFVNPTNEVGTPDVTQLSDYAALKQYSRSFAESCSQLVNH